jgi:hypothetical protein
VGTPTYHVLPVTHPFLLTALSLPPSLSTLRSRNGPFASTGHAYQLCQLANGRVDGAAVAQDKSWPSQATDPVLIRNSSFVAHTWSTQRERTNNVRQPGHAARRGPGTLQLNRPLHRLTEAPALLVSSTKTMRPTGNTAARSKASLFSTPQRAVQCCITQPWH